MPSNDDETKRAITNAYNNTWRRENIEHRRTYEREQYAENRTERRKQVRHRYVNETEEQRAARAAYQREYAKNNREALLENKRRYREKNREKIQQSEHARIRDENGDFNAKYRHKTQRATIQRAIDLETMAGRPRPTVCEACGGAPDKGKSLHYDHCHTHGHFRGWLCRECNLVLGHVQDNPARLLRLVEYLARTKE